MAVDVLTFYLNLLCGFGDCLIRDKGLPDWNCGGQRTSRQSSRSIAARGRRSAVTIGRAGNRLGKAIDATFLFRMEPTIEVAYGIVVSLLLVHALSEIPGRPAGSETKRKSKGLKYRSKPI